MSVIDKIAWLHLRNGEVLSTRSHGKDRYYFPGGKREPGETDAQTLLREIEEELTVALDPTSLVHAGPNRDHTCRRLGAPARALRHQIRHQSGKYPALAGRQSAHRARRLHGG